MGKLTISMAIFNSFLLNYQRVFCTGRKKNVGTTKYFHVGLGQYLLIPFLGRWTSINPSYFDVNYRGTTFWHTAMCFRYANDCELISLSFCSEVEKLWEHCSSKQPDKTCEDVVKGINWVFTLNSFGFRWKSTSLGNVQLFQHTWNMFENNNII